MGAAAFPLSAVLLSSAALVSTAASVAAALLSDFGASVAVFPPPEHPDNARTAAAIIAITFRFLFFITIPLFS